MKVLNDQTKKQLIDKTKKAISESQKRDIVIQEDYLVGEDVKLNMDVYQLTIAANITKDISP